MKGGEGAGVGLLEQDMPLQGDGAAGCSGMWLAGTAPYLARSSNRAIWPPRSTREPEDGIEHAA